MKLDFGASAFTVLFLFLCSCKKSNQPPKQNPAIVNVYVGGFCTADNNGNFAAIYWRNGVIDTIPAEGQLYTMAVSDSNVYTTGTDRYVDQYAGNSVLNQYWKNNSLLTIPVANASILSVTAYGTNIYALGYYPANGADTSYNISYWKNGNEVNLVQNIGSRVGITPIVNYGSDVYVAGVQEISPNVQSGNDSIFYWKNGQRVYVASAMQNISTPGLSAYSVALSGSDIYIFGQMNVHATYWKNGVPTTLPDSINYGGGHPYSNASHAFAVSGKDVYIAGSVNSKALYWKNGSINYLPNGMYAFCIAVSGQDVYIGGMDNNGNAALWKNGVEEVLGQGYTACIVLQ